MTEAFADAENPEPQKDQTYKPPTTPDQVTANDLSSTPLGPCDQREQELLSQHPLLPPPERTHTQRY
jgi:hypothetical protein